MKNEERMKRKEARATVFVMVLEHLWFGVHCVLKHKIAGAKAGGDFSLPIFSLHSSPV